MVTSGDLSDRKLRQSRKDVSCPSPLRCLARASTPKKTWFSGD